MPKLPRVSGAEIVRALERLGFLKLHQADVSAEEFISAL